MTADRYTVISSDTHAGGSHAAYREYLDKKYVDDFDSWRAKYKNPFSDLGDDRRLRNWDEDMRNSQHDQDGVVGEVISPTPCPRSSRASCCSPGRRRLMSTSTGSRVSGPTTDGWPTSAACGRSAGPASARSS